MSDHVPLFYIDMFNYPYLWWCSEDFCKIDPYCGAQNISYINIYVYLYYAHSRMMQSAGLCIYSYLIFWSAKLVFVEIIEVGWCINASLNNVIIDSYNDLSPLRRQAVIWTNTGSTVPRGAFKWKFTWNSPTKCIRKFRLQNGGRPF